MGCRIIAHPIRQYSITPLQFAVSCIQHVRLLLGQAYSSCVVQLQIVQLSPPTGHTLFRFSDSIRGSKILPESFKAKAIERFFFDQHSRIDVLSGAEFLRAFVGWHIVEDSRIENLHAGKHELGARDCRRTRSLGVQESVDAFIRIDFHGTELIGEFIGPQNQGRCRFFLFVKRDDLSQRQIDQHVRINDDERPF